jgi:predicted GNAT family acetyltransferase
MSDSVRLLDNERELRYELWDGDIRVGLIAYRVEPGVRVLVHTEVEPRVEGKGYGAQLVRAALDDLRGRGLLVVPLCPFVAAFVRRHPEYADLVVRDPAVSD